MIWLWEVASTGIYLHCQLGSLSPASLLMQVKQGQESRGVSMPFIKKEASGGVKKSSEEQATRCHGNSAELVVRRLCFSPYLS